jgi:hypothetical protein
MNQMRRKSLEGTGYIYSSEDEAVIAATYNKSDAVQQIRTNMVY